MGATKINIYFLTIVFFIINGFHCYAQNSIAEGKSVHIDGKITKGEWCDAKIYLLQDHEYFSSKFFLKHDSENLLIAYIIEYNDSINNDTIFTMPEIFIDSKNDDGNEWQNDDFWFHVSAQDCYYQGEKDNYDNCRPDYLVWRASPNYPFGNSNERIPVFEVSIPFDLIQVHINDTIGICVSLMVYPDEKALYFPENTKAEIPASWKDFIIETNSFPIEKD
jgi:hypothetical protein